MHLPSDFLQLKQKQTNRMGKLFYFFLLYSRSYSVAQVMPLSFVISANCLTLSAPRLKKVKRRTAIVSFEKEKGSVEKTILLFSNFPFVKAVVLPVLSTQVCCHC